MKTLIIRLLDEYSAVTQKSTSFVCKMLDCQVRTIPTILEWAAQEERILLTHDVSTITRYAYDRVRLGQTMPGVIEVSPDAAVGRVIEDILVLVECSQDGELEGQVQYLPW
ncbi:hypothetical protein LC613_06715 [Nostoc sphaeroides CHAB 2801]|uniref:hypothetical protein n=1 Tax=Nostoc sphaeroides TaxID=446679 RepID=UPI001E3C3A47|nr:hypothetical protein [Nostoc sphaeroides]MCC5627844.1 hypothetical protein [Nostoc sphaeroides CHAB 2801]